MSIYRGDDLNIYCKVNGYPIPKINWYKNGQLMELNDNRYNFRSYGNIPNGHLVVHDVRDLTESEYECKASEDQFGSVTSGLQVSVVQGTILFKIRPTR